MTHTNTLVLHADKKPMKEAGQVGPHQTYRNPRLSTETRELCSLAKENIRVEMIYAGICGTDIHATQSNPATGYILGSAPLQIGAKGRVLGHEGVGRILETGANNSGLSPGDYVTFTSILTCYQCKPCRKGDFNQCENAILFGMEKDGLFGTIVDVPIQLVYKVNRLAEMEFVLQAAACIEPAGCGYVAATLAKVSPGDNVLIFGAGPIGVFTAMLCKEVFGAAQVSIVEPVSFRRELAAKWTDYSFDVQGFFSKSRAQAFDVLIEASGVMQNINHAFPSMAANSRIILLARSGEALSLKHLDHMITNNISIQGSRGHLGGAFGKLLSLYSAGRLPLHEVVTEVVYGIDGLKACFDNPNPVQNNNCKVLADFTT